VTEPVYIIDLTQPALTRPIRSGTAPAYPSSSRRRGNGILDTKGKCCIGPIENGWMGEVVFTICAQRRSIVFLACVFYKYISFLVKTRATESLATNPSSGTPATEGSRFRIGRRVGADTGADLDGKFFFHTE